MSPAIEFPCNGEMAAKLVAEALTRRGYQVVRSFDLQAATVGRCDCPAHGTSRCTCQYVVLLVYDGAAPPLVVTAHSRDERSHLEIVADPNSPPDAQMVDTVTAILAEAGGALAAVQPAVSPAASPPV